MSENIIPETSSIKCTETGCSNVQYRRGVLCLKHTAIKKGWKINRCSIDGCEKIVQARGWCAMHYSRWEAHSDPLGGSEYAPIGAAVKWIEDHVNYIGDDCLKWPFSNSCRGYGAVLYNGKKCRAPRVMCTLVNGNPSSKKLEAAHSCGNGHLGCINPNHLSWKTSKENTQDSIDHGTLAHGERLPQTKVTCKEVAEIRSLSGVKTQKEIGRAHGISQAQVSRIILKNNWGWLT